MADGALARKLKYLGLSPSTRKGYIVKAVRQVRSEEVQLTLFEAAEMIADDARPGALHDEGDLNFGVVMKGMIEPW